MWAGRNTTPDGAVAQLVERIVRNDEARGSIPLGSTKEIKEIVIGA
jgi:hypothetical protein